MRSTGSSFSAALHGHPSCHHDLGCILGGVGIALAITNVFGGFDITHKMLKMIAGKKR